MLTVSLRVIIWPENDAEHSEDEKSHILNQVLLQREGQASDIAKTVLFFVKDAPYITGQVLNVDGGLTEYFPITQLVFKKSTNQGA